MPAADLLDEWSERLARRVAPDEIDIAPDLAAAYVEGGAARRDLFAPPRADPGAFGPGLVLTLPVVLAALSDCWSVVWTFLSEDAVNTTVATAGLWVAWRQLRRGPAADAPATSPMPAPAEPDPAVAPPPEVVERAAASVGALQDRLRESVATAERAEELAREVLLELAADPDGAGRFLALLRDRRP